jgi:4-amino-4-deoxy-L-arabinose transferase-like glycosyltransferase
VRDWSGDLLTDDGYAAAGAARAVMIGTWYVPGDFNRAVDAPLWPLLLYLPFKFCGVSMGLARFIAACFYAGTVLSAYLMVRLLDTRLNAALVAALLATNYLGFQFGRLALFEAAWVFFVSASLLVAVHAARSNSLTQSFGAGFVLSLGVLTKLTAVIGFLPLIAAIVLISTVPQKRWKMVLAAVAGCLILPAVHHLIAIPYYKSDHLYNVTGDISDRMVVSLLDFLQVMIAHVVSLKYIGFFLLLCCAFGVIISLLTPIRKTDVLTRLVLVWLVSALGITTMVRYFPPRYCFCFVVPAVIFAVKSANSGFQRNKLVGSCLYVLLGLAMVSNGVEIVGYLAKPSYTFEAFAEAVRVASSDKTSRQCDFMGNFANSLSLFNRLPSENDTYRNSTMAQGIQHCDPRVYVKLGPASLDDERQFRASGKALVLESKSDLLDNYYNGQPAYLYKVVPSAVDLK